MAFYLIRQGQGEGCDYTLDCNKTFDKLSAQTIEDAHTEATSMLMPDEPEHWGYLENEPHYIRKAIIVQSMIEMDVEAIYDTCREMTKARKDKEKLPKKRQSSSD
jgi:hypothetical protein